MRHRQAIALLALVGFGIALYLWLYKMGYIGRLQCGTGSCEYVQSSPYGDLWGVPVAFYGVLGYAVIFAVVLTGLQPALLSRRWPTQLVAVLAAGGWLFTVYLTYVELFVLHAICRWCLSSAVVITLITLIAVPAALRREQGARSST
ncbi:MAG TPA: vitamin K epoxide reductase family protein [Gemmatimonadales bacterium]